MLSEYEEADRLFISVFDFVGNNKCILVSYGDVLDRLGHYVDAFFMVNVAINVFPNDGAVATALRGKIYTLRGAFARALHISNAADGLKPNDAYILELRGDVRMLREHEGALEV
jgi:tetratricopeptide (TPR) repeat protein